MSPECFPPPKKFRQKTGWRGCPPAWPTHRPCAMMNSTTFSATNSQKPCARTLTKPIARLRASSIFLRTKPWHASDLPSVLPSCKAWLRRQINQKTPLSRRSRTTSSACWHYLASTDLQKHSTPGSWICRVTMVWRPIFRLQPNSSRQCSITACLCGLNGTLSFLSRAE